MLDLNPRKPARLTAPYILRLPLLGFRRRIVSFFAFSKECAS